MAIAFLNNITFSGGAQAEKLRVENLGSDPASGNEGQLYFNTATDKVKVYANGAWTDLDGANDFLTGLSFNTGDGVLTATIPNQSNVTVDLDGRYALSSSIPGTIVESVTAGTYLNNSGTAADVILNHDNTSRTDTTSTSSPGSGGTVDLVNTITTNATGHVTAVDIQTVTFPTNTNETYTLPVSIGGGSNFANLELTAGGSGSGIKSTVTISGTTNEIAIAGFGGNNGTVTVGLPNDVTIADDLTVGGELTVSGTGQSSFGGQVTVPATPSANTDAASKQYVLSQVGGVGGFQGGYNATTNTPALTGASNVALNQGDFYVVTTSGTFFTENVEVGDFIFANSNIAANSSPSLSDYTVVIADQNVAGEGATDGATQKGVAGFNSAHFNVTANGFVSSDIYAGGSTLGIVPAGGAGTTFLRGDGTWAVPVDTGALGDRVALTGGSQAGGLTTFTYDVTNSFTGANAIDVKCEVISAAGETVYAGVTRSGANLSVEFIGSISDSAYEVLLTYVG